MLLSSQGAPQGTATITGEAVWFPAGPVGAVSEEPSVPIPWAVGCGLETPGHWAALPAPPPPSSPPPLSRLSLPGPLAALLLIH